MAKPITFYCVAPDAQSVSVSGDFNDWSRSANPMKKTLDGRWMAQVELHHGHHHYVFVVDDKKILDPLAQGIGRDMNNEKVSLIAVS